jgi:hypothetical protein
MTNRPTGEICDIRHHRSIQQCQDMKRSNHITNSWTSITNLTYQPMEGKK